MSRSPAQFPPPADWYDRLVTEHDLWEECEGIPLAIARFTDDSGIRAQVAAALRLIATHSPYEFARIGRLMRGIVVTRLYGHVGEWRRSTRICMLSIHYLEKEKPSPSAIASTIVHELAHARLAALGVASTEERGPRIERICYRAEERFVRALPESPERDAVLAELEQSLEIDTGIWRAVLRRDYRPWYVRALVYCLRRAGDLWHRAAPT